jgi:hypothetical protein
LRIEELCKKEFTLKTNFEVVERLFEKGIEKLEIPRINLYLCRADGVIVFKKVSFGEESQHQSIGALIGGVWQAASSISNFLPGQDGNNIFRLSFDTSSSGIYILPVWFAQKEHYIGAIFQNENNPGFLKKKLRGFISYIEENSIGSSETIPDDQRKEKKSEFLFNNITDEEVDQLFSSIGN